MSFTAECKEHFGTSDLYAILGVDNEKKAKKISSSEIKKAYYKISLKWHPDRIKENNEKATEIATVKFQILSKAYSVLSNKEKRNVYDETGVIDDENILSDDKDWMAYWRLLFKKVTKKDIEDFYANYRESEEELTDLKQAYLQNEGDMNKVMDSVPCSTFEDEDRFTKILKDLIAKDEVPNFDTFSKETTAKKQKRKRKAEKEAKEAEAALREIERNEGHNDLEKMIQQRQGNRTKQMDGFLDQLEAKYASGSSKPKSKKK